MSLWHTINIRNTIVEGKDSMGMKRLYLVTGAYGHLGHTIVDELLARGENVRGLALPGDSIPAPVRRGLEIYQGDVCHPDSLAEFFHVDEPCEMVVIHTAGIVSIASKFNQKVFDVNVVGTKNIVDMCRKTGVKRLIHVSSVHAIPEKAKGETVTEVSRFDYRKVEGLYAQTKAKATQIVLNAAASGLDAVVVHPSGILGPGDYGHGHLTQLVSDYLNGRLTACVKGGYDFVDVRDVAAGILAAVDKGRKGECYILSNRFYSVRELLDTLHEVTGRKKIKTVLPLWFAKGTAPLAETYYKILKQPPLYTRYSLYTLTGNGRFSHEKADRELGYTTRDMRDTLRDTAAFLIAQGRIRHPGRLSANLG